MPYFRPDLEPPRAPGRHFTEPQRKALLWLTPGSECGGAPREVSAALASLALYHRDLVTKAWRRTERGRRYLTYKLTDAGVAARAGIA